MRVVLQDELLEIEEGSLVIDLLAKLNHGVPRVLGGFALARVTHACAHRVRNIEVLLHDRTEGFFLDCQLDDDAPAVRLRPDELGVDKPHLIETLELLET